MVLKLTKSFPEGITPDQLQSNHYGIETGSLRKRVFFKNLLQSNHYGIETGWTPQTWCRQHQARCNRTIMVLKLIDEKIKGFIVDELQSNHYGIETGMSVITKPTSLVVAIEPLWYWNLGFMLRRALLIRLVAIEPLWYWNRFSRPYSSSNSKVAIEPLWYWNGIYASHQALKFHLVAIEPLWYWNQSPPQQRGSHKKCCNRTIMVLKLTGVGPAVLGSKPLQSNHYGIETVFLLSSGKGKARVAIEPLWYWNSF